MSKKTDAEKFNSMRMAGNFTKNAVKNFEEHIVHDKDYVENVTNH